MPDGPRFVDPVPCHGATDIKLMPKSVVGIVPAIFTCVSSQALPQKPLNHPSISCVVLSFGTTKCKKEYMQWIYFGNFRLRLLHWEPHRFCLRQYGKPLHCKTHGLPVSLALPSFLIRLTIKQVLPKWWLIPLVWSATIPKLGTPSLFTGFICSRFGLCLWYSL